MSAVPLHAAAGARSPGARAPAGPALARVGRPRHRIRIACALAGGLLLAGCATEREPALMAGADPDSVASAFATPGAALTRAGATRSFQVRSDGSLFNGVWSVLAHASSGGAEAGPPRRIAYAERWCPVARWRRASGAVRWDFEAVVLPAAGDTALVASLAVRATNEGTAPAAVALGFEIAPAPRQAGWLALDCPPDGTALPGWRESATGVAGYAPGSPADAAPGWHATLGPGASRAWRVLLGAYSLPRGTYARLARSPHAHAVEEVRAQWRRATGSGLQVDVGDPELEVALRAARVVLLQNRDRFGGRWLPRGGPFQYQDTWLRDGARSVAALAVAGHTREARELADGLAGYQWASGAFMSQRGQLDGNGQAMWAFAQAGLRPAPDSTVARFAALAFGAAQWVRAQRLTGAASGLPFGSMLPFGDPHDGELVRAQLVGNDAWGIAGLESCARLLRAAGRGRDAAAVDSLRAAYAADFAAALARTRSADVPPAWNGGGRDWGNLAVAWPCRALPADHARCAALARRVWAAGGGSGMVCYGERDSLHNYVGADLGTWALLAGRPADAERVLDALLAWRDATGAGAELFSRSRRDYGRNFPPHPTSAAALVQLARNMLVYDDGDTLQLTLGARERWWRAGRVRGAPTRWGTLDLAFERHGGEATWHWTPVPVWTALTLPPGTRLLRATAAPLRGAPGDRVVLAPPRTAAARIALAADRGPGTGARP